jgi:hypothetical protein
MRGLWSLFLSLFIGSPYLGSAAAQVLNQSYEVTSPDRNIQVTVHRRSKLAYSTCFGRTISVNPCV